MSADFIPALAALLAFGLALAAGWFIWGRPLSEARHELAERREALGRAVAEVAAFKAQADEAKPYVERAAQLQAELAAARSAADARDDAHAQALAERDRVHAQHMQETHTQFQRAAGEALEQARTRLTEAERKLNEYQP